MKKFFIGLFLLVCTFAASYYMGQRRKLAAMAPSSVFKFIPSPYPKVNHSFVIVIVGFNNGAWLEKTLHSACHQNYPNFRIIYIDDASTDGSFDLAKDLVLGSEKLDQIVLLQNEEHLGVAANLTRAVASCSAQEIVVVLGGEDWLAHDWVLARLNQYYANPDLWITYGQSREYPSYSMGVSKEADLLIEPRKQPFFASHLQSFYADLFQHIAPEHLRYPAAVQQSYMLPMLEMAGAHATFIPEILYIVNKLGAKESFEMADVCEKSIRSLSAYASLTRRHLDASVQEEN